MFKNRLQAKCVYNNALQEPSWLIVSMCWWILCTVGSQPQLFIPCFPTHILHKHVEKDWMQLNTAAFQSGVESWSASARCFLLPVGLFRLWQQIVPCPFFSRTWSRVCGRILLILWCTFALLFFSSLCFGACCCLSSLKSLEVQSTSYKNLLSCDECIILPHLTIFFNTPT